MVLRADELLRLVRSARDRPIAQLGLYPRVNLYESSSTSFNMNGHMLTVEQSSAYPGRGQMFLQVETDTPVSFPLRLRIQYLSQKIRIALNDQDIDARSEKDGYLSIHRQSCMGEKVQIRFEIPVYLYRFMNDQYGVVARGSEVLSIDQLDNPSIDHDGLAIPNDFALRGTLSVDGRRRYLGGVVANGKLTQAIFTPLPVATGRGFEQLFPSIE